MNSNRYWLLLYPDITKPIGGAKQIHRLAEALTQLGQQATIVQQNKSFHPGWFESSVSTISLNDWRNIKDPKYTNDIIIMPETFLPLITKIKPGVKKIIFNQNGAYSFGPLHKEHDFGSPKDVLDLYRHPDLIHTLCVSDHDFSLLTQGFGISSERVSILINAIETDLFFPNGNKKPLFSFMPRKNERDASIVTTLLRNQPWFKGWKLQKIENFSQNEVISSFQRAYVCYHLVILRALVFP